MSEKDKVTIPNIHQALSGIPFPAERKTIIEYARNKGASGGIIDLLLTLDNQEFGNEPEIISSLQAKHDYL